MLGSRGVGLGEKCSKKVKGFTARYNGCVIVSWWRARGGGGAGITRHTFPNDTLGL